MREWLTRVRDWFRRDQLDAELAEELRFHHAQIERDAGATGTAAEDVAWAARRQLGNLTQVREEARERWSLPWFDHLQQDVRYAVRGLRRSPGFTLTVILTLGLGIGVNAAIFSAVDRLLFRAPPLLEEPGRTHRLYFSYPLPDESGGRFVLDAVPYARYVHLDSSTQLFERITQYSANDLAIGVGDDAREMRVGGVGARFFGFFDAPPVLGRYFSPSEDLPPNGAPLAVLSYAIWQTRFGGRPDALGATLQIGPTVYTVIGVAPRGFVGLWPDRPPVVYVPFAAYAAGMKDLIRREAWWTSRTANLASILVRRERGVTLATANAHLTDAFLRSFEDGFPYRPNVIAASVLTERGPNQTNAAKVAGLVGAMALIVLLIACANVTNLLLTRALRRRHEIAIRLAIGVRRGRLIRQLLTESVLLSLLGGVGGLVAAQVGGSVLRAVILPAGAQSPVVGDTRTLLFVGIVVLIVGLVAGLVPAFRVARFDLTHRLKAGAHEGTIAMSRARTGLLVLQGALSVLLLVGAGLFVRSLSNVTQLRLGYDIDQVLRVNLNMRGLTLDSARTLALHDRLLTAARGISSVERAALSSSLPFGQLLFGHLRVPGIDTKVLRRLPDFYVNFVTPEYFAVMGTRIVRGRGFDRRDVAGAPTVIVVSETMAKTLWPGKDALGQCVNIGEGDEETCTSVIGIAEDIKNTRLSDDAALYYYVSAAQFHSDFMGLVLRTLTGATRQAEVIRQVLQREMPGASYVTITPFANVVGHVTRSWRLGATMFAAFGVLALVLAAVGLYAVIAYNVAQRSHEVGVRIALGAQRPAIVWLVVRQGVLLGGLGIVIGAAIALAVAGRIAPLLFAVSPRDPLVYGLVVTVMLAVAIAASAIPAQHAARVDPNVSLRSD
jgi:putative ABC transport system permease protein